SRDSGQTWSILRDALGGFGPLGQIDTRFYVKGSDCYALGFDSTLWRYLNDPPTLTMTSEEALHRKPGQIITIDVRAGSDIEAGIDSVALGSTFDPNVLSILPDNPEVLLPF